MHYTLFTTLLAASVACVSTSPLISTFKNSLALDASFDPVIAAYWTGLPHHRRTPFAVSPDGKSAYLAYLDVALSTVHVQQVDTTTFAAVGASYKTPGFEAAGLVAHNDGFALLATVKATGTASLPPDNGNIISLIRVKDGTEAWRTPLNGPGVHTDTLTYTPDANGDLVYSPASGLYAAYFVVAAYSGYASGHFGDSIQYVNDAGVLQDIPEASEFGCSHNTGIGLEAADAPPFSSICSEDHGGIWLNTDTRYMSGVKIANENTTNGVSGEPMGGMSGSYSNLALFPGTTQYIFAWQSRGALNLYTDSWMGPPYVQSSPRWLNHNVAIATLSSKNKLSGAQASSVVGAGEGDSQVNWITKSETVDHQNVHVATLNSSLSLVTWENLSSPKCEAVPLGCSGTFAGTSFQFVNSAGVKVGTETVNAVVTVSGDMAVVNGKICWPYVDQAWTLSAPRSKGTPVQKMSFACAAVDGNAAAAAPVSSSSAVVASSSPVAVSSATAPKPTSATAQNTVSSVLPTKVISSSAVILPSSVAPVVKPISALPTSLSPSQVISSTSALISIIPSTAPSSTADGVIPSPAASSSVPFFSLTVIPSSTFSTVYASPTSVLGDDGEDGECEW